MCMNYIGKCACSCGCNNVLEKTAVSCREECDRVAIPNYYEVFDYRCKLCWPWTPESTSDWSKGRRGKYWWYVPFWKRRSILSGRVPGVCVKGRDLSDLTSTEIWSQDYVSQVYSNLDLLYGDALELGLTIDELEVRTGTLRSFPTTVSGYPALNLEGLKWLSNEGYQSLLG
ncbi:hypothetical protein MGN70_002786 [Eutypa lata]|nr:hypothetical protein MGN70_002786 [Eutypa lata]